MHLLPGIVFRLLETFESAALFINILSTNLQIEILSKTALKKCFDCTYFHIILYHNSYYNFIIILIKNVGH